MSINSAFLRGGVVFWDCRGGGGPILFLCARGFSEFWVASIHHLMWKIICEFEPQIGYKLSHHVMPKVLVFKAPRRHVQKSFLPFFCRSLAEKDHITWWMRPADISVRGMSLRFWLRFLKWGKESQRLFVAPKFPAPNILAIFQCNGKAFSRKQASPQRGLASDEDLSLALQSFFLISLLLFAFRFVLVCCLSFPSGPKETSWCRGTFFVSQWSCNYPHRRGYFEMPLLWVRDSLRGILGLDLGKGSCESKTVLRHSGETIFAPRQPCFGGFFLLFPKQQGLEGQGKSNIKNPQKGRGNLLCWELRHGSKIGFGVPLK